MSHQRRGFAGPCVIPILNFRQNLPDSKQVLHRGKSSAVQLPVKDIITCYIFLGISLLFYLIFFYWQQELQIFGVAILCDVAAVVYIFRVIKTMFPYWQISQAQTFLQNPSRDTYYRLCSSLEYPGKKCRYNDKSKAVLEQARKKSEELSELTPDDRTILVDNIRNYVG